MALQAAGFINGRGYDAEDVRRLAFAATNGTTGVVKGGTHVTATPTPSTRVVLNSFVGYIESPFGAAQSYVVSNDQAYEVEVPANKTSAPVVVYVVVVVDDPQYVGSAYPSDPKTGLYNRLVVAVTYPVSKPNLLLATIRMPANSSVVTQAMVTQEAIVANPRRDSKTVVSSPGTTYALGSAYQQWPPNAVVYFDCPKWARRINVRVDLSGVEVMNNGYNRAELKPTVDGMSDDQPVSMTTRNQQAQRFCFFTVATVLTTASQRGNQVAVGLRGGMKAGVAGSFQIDAETNVVYAVEFLEQ